MAKKKVEVEELKLSSFKVQQKNANAHTERGLEALGNAYSEVGYVAPMTAAANGELLDGSARLEKAEEQFSDEALVIRHDGKKPIIMVREDIETADSPKAKMISYGANRIGELGLDWDAAQIAKDLDEGLDIHGLFEDHELEELMKEIPQVEFKEYDEGVENEVEYLECPHCGEKFPK